MLIAFEDLGVKKEDTTADPRIADCIQTIQRAQWLRKEAKRLWPETHWVIVGKKPPYGVHGPLSEKEFDQRLQNLEEIMKFLRSQRIVSNHKRFRLRYLLEKIIRESETPITYGN